MQGAMFGVGILILFLIFLVLFLYFEYSRYKNYKKDIEKRVGVILNANAKIILLKLLDIVNSRAEHCTGLERKKLSIASDIRNTIARAFDDLAYKSPKLTKKLFDILRQETSDLVLNNEDAVIGFLEWNSDIFKCIKEQENDDIEFLIGGLYYKKYHEIITLLE